MAPVPIVQEKSFTAAAAQSREISNDGRICTPSRLGTHTRRKRLGPSRRPCLPLRPSRREHSLDDHPRRFLCIYCRARALTLHCARPYASRFFLFPRVFSGVMDDG